MDLQLLPATATEDEIHDELAFVEVLIESLDTGADDYPERLEEYEHARAHLQQLLQPFLTSQRQQGRPGNAVMNGSTSNDHLQHDNFWQTAANEQPRSNHSSNSGMSSSPFALLANNNFATSMNGAKRARPESFTAESTDYAMKRRTLAQSNVATPVSSTESFDMSDSLDRTRAKQAAAEAAARKQSEVQKADARYAAALAAEMDQPPPASFASSSHGHQNFQTTFKYNGSYQRPPPVQQPQPSSSRQPQPYQNLPFPQPQPQRQSAAPSIKPEYKPDPGFPQDRALQQRHQQIVDLTASDSDDDDIAEIAPSRFTPNNIRQQAVPWRRSQMPGAYPMPNVFNEHSVYGGENANNNPGLLRQTVSGAVSGLSHAAGRLGGHINQLNNLLYGSSGQPFDLDDDDDDDDVVFGGMRPLHAIPGYAGNESLYQQRYDAMAAYDPTQSKEEIQNLLQNIRPDEDMPAHLRVSTPEDMSVELHKYQEMGLTWLQKQEAGSNMGGILADDMGLGKTIQMLALMVTRRSEEQRCKTTLIVAPLALMRQWKQEIQDKLKPGRAALKVFTHHGSTKAKDWQELRQYDVVLTTFGSLGIELKRMEKFRLRQTQDSNARPHSSEKCIFLDPDARWYRIILDEAQCIKNKSTQTAKAACMLNATYRWCVTGTPMMNNVEELYSLVKFLRIKPYCVWEKFRLDFKTPLKNGSKETKANAMRRLQALCKAVMLRRTKKSTFEGKPILILPERTTTVDNPVFDEEERSLYTAIEQNTQLQFNRYLRRGTVGNNYSAILVLLLRLRQACCHPHLIKDFGVSVAADMTEDQMLEFARLLQPGVVARIKESGGDFECPVCYDVTPNPAIFVPCGHDTCSECFTRLADPANAIQNGDEAGGIRCPNCRGGIDPKRLTDFISFKKVHMPELLTDEERGAKNPADGSGAEDDENSDTDDDSSSDCDSEAEDDDSLDGFVVRDDEIDYDDDSEEANSKPVKAEKSGKKIKSERAEAGPSNAAGKQPRHQKDKKKISKKAKGKQKEKKEKKKIAKGISLADLKKMATRNKAAKKQYLRRLRKDWVSSAKIDKTMEILDQVMSAKEGEKVLIFSQWTSLLDLLEIPIDTAGYGYRRYDGSMSPDMRGEAVDDFKDPKKNVRIMLISLKAGNAGLNLNVASQVIILDPFWNPYIEEQAIDRAHRIGQKNEVTVHRVLVGETVEDRIILLQDKKRALISEALDEKSGHSIARLGVQELAYLFGVTHDPSDRVENAAPRR